MSKMTQSENTLETYDSAQDVEVKCLEPLLKKSLHNKNLQVIDFSTIKLLPPGENYASIMLKIDVKVRENKSAREETLHFVAKTSNCSENLVFNWPLVFKKELFMYVELGPLYKQLERDAGIEECALIDIWPEYIGHRNSLSDGNEIDNDSLILMENIKYKNFYTLDKRLGLDILHARRALTSLARYHALGIVMQEKQLEFAKKAIDQSRVLGLNFALIDAYYDNVLRTFRGTLSLQKHMSIIETSFDGITKGKTWMTEPTKPWATITHGDFWTNNILFHKDDEGKVDDVKFVDFQTYLYGSALKDLPYFLCGSLTKETQTNNLDELISLYYNTFTDTLKCMSCDTSLFTKKSFHSELKKQAINEFPHCAMAIKVFDFESSGNSTSYGGLNDIFGVDADNSYITRLKKLVEVYENMGWF